MVVNQFGLLVMLLSGFMLIAPAVAAAFRGLPGDASAVGAMIITGTTSLLLGSVAFLLSRKGDKFLGRKEALLLVATSWIGGALVAALPFWLWALWDSPAGHPFRSLVHCYFEAMSGLTTTGATVLGGEQPIDIESLPPSLLLWRSLTHWLGGLGIVVLFVAVLPGLGVGGKRLFNIEASGPAKEGLQPQIRETARWLWYIYVGLTVAEFLLLRTLGGLDSFDSLNHTFATLSTGGFSTRNASIGAFEGNLFVYPIIITFMLLAGVNFGLYYKLGRGKLTNIFADTELRVYLGLTALGTVLIALTLIVNQTPITMTDATVHETPGWLGAFWHSTFATVTSLTGTGFCAPDFENWPFLAKGLIVTIMFVGPCSGSTGGGMKVIRVWVGIKLLLAEIEHIFRPQVIRPVRLGNTTLDPELRLGTAIYLLGVLVLFAGGAFLVMFFEQFNSQQDLDPITALTASIATLSNVGPGLGLVGPTGNYGGFTSPSLLLMSLLMALGRLEVYAIIVLFSPTFWRRD